MTRRVRTPAGERRFKQPKGAIIVADFVPNIPEGTPLGADSHDIGRRVRYHGPDAPAHNPVELEGTLIRFRRNRGQTVAQIQDDDEITHVINVPSDIWSRMSYVMVPIEDSETAGWEVGTINGQEYYIGQYNRRWYVLKDGDWDGEMGKFKTREEAVDFLEQMAATPRPKNRKSRTARAKEAADTDFPRLIQEAIMEDERRREAAGKPKQTRKDIESISKPFHNEMKHRGLAFYDQMPIGTWFTPLNDSALKHGTYRKKSKREFVSELGVVYSSAHIGPVVRPIPARKVLEATLDSIINVLRHTEIKAELVSLRDQLEVKTDVRRVATPAGVRRYGLPIGSIIVARDDRAKTGERLRYLWQVAGGKVDADGWETFEGEDESKYLSDKGKSKAAIYKVGETEDGWVAYDEDDELVAQHKDKGEMLKILNDYIKENMKAQWEDTKVGNAWVDIHGERPDPEGAHRATGEELEALGSAGMTRRQADVFIWDDQDAHPKSYGYGVTRTGRHQMFRKNEGVKASQASKFATVRAMRPNMPDFEEMIHDKWKGNDTISALWFMRTYAMRVGKPGTGRRKESRGATQIEAQHVKITPTSATLTLPSKGGKTLVYIVDKNDDPFGYQIVKEAMKGKSGTDKLFDTKSDRTEREIKKVFGPNATNHNLRHYRATEEAVSLIEGWLEEGYPKPTSYEELVAEWGKPIGEIVEKTILKDEDGQGWTSYIDPDVLMSLVGKNVDWVDQFREQFGDKGLPDAEI